ncbi:SUF system NifU family Fe-S cluster assembly protein, partial [bacterium]|nr:SUF system NifU family Fe-S cluster assembly protein [bacterium]
MSDLLTNDDLYRQIIIDHYNNPHNNCHLENPTYTSEGENATCGDHIELDLIVKDGVITDVGFDGGGCCIFTASASILTDMVKGQKIEDVINLAKSFKARLSVHSQKESIPDANEIDLGELEALDGVKDY